MAEAVVSLALEGIGGWLNGKETILKEVKGKVDELQMELRDIRRFLKSADAKQYDDDQIRDLVAEVREAAYDAEDVISNFVLEVESREGRAVKNDISRAFVPGNESARSKIASQIDSIKNDIARLKGSLVSYGLVTTTERGCSSSALGRRTFHFDFEPDFVGFKKDVKTLVAKLLSEDKHRVISICGMGGLGKTTLAQRLYRDQEVKGHFKAVAWVSISQQWNRKDVLQRILTGLMPEMSNKIVYMIEDRLAELLNFSMQDKKCLVVLDDIWSERAWDDLSQVFPHANSSSKIMLTTRNKNVATYADPLGYIHDLDCLSNEEGLELLLKKAILQTAESTDSKIDPSKKELGMKMVEQCGCLPLAIVVLGGLLATKHSLIAWQEVHRNVASYLEGRKDYVGEYRRVSKVFDLSYRELSYELKACFLYLASFPEDFDIETERLYHMWMTEGFVSHRDNSHEATMEIAKQKLDELAQRCMVQVKLDSEEKSVINVGRRFKSLRLHDLMRDFCLLKAKEENFLTVINYGLDEQVQHPSLISSTGASSGNSHKIHRVAIHLPNKDSVRNLQLLQRKGKLKYIRTLVLFYNDCTIEGQFNSIYKDSRLLRVLNFVTNTNCKTFRALQINEIEVGNSILLRYLSIERTGFQKLQSSIENLRYLQTLDLRTLCPIVVSNVLWKMEGLIHLYLPFYHKFSTDGSMLRVDGLNNLETIENLDPNKVDVKGLFNLTKLRRLKRICMWNRHELLGDINNNLLKGNHPQLQEISFEFLYSDFCSKEDLSNLRQLLSRDRLAELCIDESITRLPRYNPQLLQIFTSLTLYDVKLEEDGMAILEKLPNLRRLELLVNAFLGKEIVFSAHGFPNLKYLWLYCLKNLEEWRVDNAMPNLSTLFIQNCNKLKMLPDGLRFITTLQELKIIDMPNEFYDKLRIGGEDFHKVCHIPSIVLNQPSGNKFPVFYHKERVLGR